MLAEGLVARGHNVTVIAAVPHYPSGRVPSESSSWSRGVGTYGGVSVHRVSVPSIDRSSLPMRLFQFLCFQLGATLASRRYQPEVVLVSNPALETFFPFEYWSSVRRTPTVFSIHDVYPDVGVSLGIFKNKYVINAIEMIEGFCVRRAKRVRVLGESFFAPVKRLGADRDRTSLIYDWTDVAAITPVSKQNAFAVQYELQDKFVLLYAGNIGLSQGIERLLDLAAQYKDDHDVRLLLVGEGAGRSVVEQRIRQENLTNVLLLHFQPSARLAEMLWTADV